MFPPRSGSDQLMILNVGGSEFWTKVANLRKLPRCSNAMFKMYKSSQRSRLGRIVFASSMEEILRFCDGFVAGDIPQVQCTYIDISLKVVINHDKSYIQGTN